MKTNNKQQNNEKLKYEKGKYAFSLFTLLFSFLSFAQSLTTSENYVYTKVYLSADGSKKNESVQYFDGLGRAKQVVQVKATPLGQDLVVPIEYDGQTGRESKKMLPIPAATGNGAIHGSANAAAVNSYYGIANAYSEQKIEASPLARVLETAHPGSEWAMASGHTAKMQYLTNTDADQVKKFNTSVAWANSTLTTAITSVATYNANQLFKNKVINEDGNATVEYKDSQGKTILVRKEGAAGNLDTYYVYNIYNQLAFVISPKGNEKIAANGNVVSSQILDDLCYQYVYDNRFRQVEKKLPGKGWEFMVFDQQNRLVATQDAGMRYHPENPNRWLFTRYDKFGRVLYTGVFTGGTRLQEQANANAKGLNNENRSSTSFTLNGQEIFYTNTAYPSAAFVPYSVNYYDSYPGTNANNTLPVPFSVLGQITLSGAMPVSSNGVNSVRSLQSMATASMVKNLEDDAWSSTHIWYDQKGRAIGSQGKNHLGGYTKTEKQLDFSGAVLFANTYHKKTASDALEVVINERFVYDNTFRLKQHYHKVNSNPEELLADYTYNELGQVISKKVGNHVQDMQYTYNVRGAVVKVNDPANLAGKLFAYELKFASTSNSSVAPANYNGNITEMIWKNAGDGVLKKYSYQYDSYNRLTAALYQEPESTVPQNGFYNETIAYDSNGNITGLKRNQKSYNGTAEEIDDLVYSYLSGNRLNSVTDLKANYSGYPDTSGNTISYDENGNMTSHNDKGILELRYNILDLPSYIKFNNYVERLGQNVYRNLTYFYRADGVKIKKVHHYFSGKNKSNAYSTTEYIDGFQYGDDQFGFVGPPVLKFFATSEGYFDYQNNRYIYHYTDHLGNVRVSFTREGSEAIIVDKNDYYAFGLKHGGPTLDATGVNYRYQYNGKEMQDEIGMYDYGARFYMPDLGRWGVMDPLSESYRSYSPYHYAMNNPMRFIDPDGRTAMDTMMQLGGTWQNVGFGFFNAELGKYIDYEGNIMNAAQVLESRSFINGGGGAGAGGGSNIILNFIRGDKNGLGNFINNEFEKNGWHIIDAISLSDALSKLKLYLGDNQADNIYINAHGLASERYYLNENGEAVFDSNTGNYKMVGDTGFYTAKDQILGSDLQQYVSDKSKLSSAKISSIDSLIGITNYVKNGKNLILGSCWTVRYDDFFGANLSSIVKSKDIFANRDYSSLWTTGGKISFQNFTSYNQTSQKHYIKGWVQYRDGITVQQSFNIIMTKYGVKTIK